MWQLCPANYICRSSLRSLSPHIPPLPSQAHWPPHLHPHGGARGGSCHCDGWVCGSGPWTTPAACRVAGSTPQPCRDGRWWPTPPGLRPGQWKSECLILLGEVGKEWDQDGSWWKMKSLRESARKHTSMSQQGEMSITKLWQSLCTTTLQTRGWMTHGKGTAESWTKMNKTTLRLL